MKGTGRETFNHGGLFVRTQPNILSPPPYPFLLEMMEKNEVND